LHSTFYIQRHLSDLKGFISNAPQYAQIVLTDRYGRMAATAGLTEDRYYYGGQSWWQKTWNYGQGDIYLLVDRGVFLISFATISLVGLLSGTWPAVKASRLNPVEALRYEQ
jgi:ABC-type lipoprotein release transport system permease subunit